MLGSPPTARRWPGDPVSLRARDDRPGVDQILPRNGDPRLWERYVRDARSYVELAEAANGPIGRRTPSTRSPRPASPRSAWDGIFARRGDRPSSWYAAWAGSSSSPPAPAPAESRRAGPPQPRRAGVNLLPNLSAAIADEISERVRQAKRPGDFAVYSVHWGSTKGWTSCTAIRPTTPGR
jgi:hypothetical protein